MKSQGSYRRLNNILLFFACFISILIFSPRSEALNVAETPIGLQTETHFITFCAYCSTSSDFKQAAIDYQKTNGLRGDFVTEVINPTTGIAYFLEVIYQPVDSPYYATGPAMFGQAGDLAVAKAILHLWHDGVLLQITPADAADANKSGTFNSFPSFQSIDGCSAIYNAFVADPATNPATTWWTYIKDYLESGSDIVNHLNANLGFPVVTVIFLNDDVAQFQLYSPDSSDTCKYVKGSARNSKGKFIPDTFLQNGNGISNGSNYVINRGDGAFGIILYGHSGEACVKTPLGTTCQFYYYLNLSPS